MRFRCRVVDVTNKGAIRARGHLLRSELGNAVRMAACPSKQVCVVNELLHGRIATHFMVPSASYENAKPAILALAARESGDPLDIWKDNAPNNEAEFQVCDIILGKHTTKIVHVH